MMYFNSVHLMGEVVAEPELRHTNNGLAVVNLRVRLKRPILGQSGSKKEDVTYLDVTVWDQLAVHCAETIRNGTFVFVDGYLKSESWESNGERRSKIKVVAHQLHVLNAASRNVREPEHAPDLPPPPRPARRSMADTYSRVAPSLSDRDQDDIPF